MAEPIVIGVALRDDDRAPVALGRDLVQFSGAPLAVAHVFPYESTGPVSAAADATALQGEALLAIAQHVAPLCGKLEVKLRAEPGTSRVRGLRRAARRLNASLLVVGASHRGRVGRIVPGGLAERLLHAPPCALAVAPRNYTGSTGGIRRIGVALNDSPEGHEALDGAAAMAVLGGATLSVLTVGEEALSSLPADVIDAVAVLEGDPANALAAASADVDLLVCGSRGFVPLHGALVGGVSATLAHCSACPLIVLPREHHGRARRSQEDGANGRGELPIRPHSGRA